MDQAFEEVPVELLKVISHLLDAQLSQGPISPDETAKALQTIARTLSSKDDATGQDRGKLAAIGKVEERIVYLLRGRDSLTVLIATATVGKELYHAL